METHNREDREQNHSAHRCSHRDRSECKGEADKRLHSNHKRGTRCYGRGREMKATKSRGERPGATKLADRRNKENCR